MAILKDLIVLGNSRFVGKTFGIDYNDLKNRPIYPIEVTIEGTTVTCNRTYAQISQAFINGNIVIITSLNNNSIFTPGMSNGDVFIFTWYDCSTGGTYSLNGVEVLVLDTNGWRVLSASFGGGGGASALNDLSDVVVDPQTLGEGHTFRYDAVNHLWRNSPGPVLPTGTCNDSSSTAKTVTIAGVSKLVNGLLIRVVNSGTTAAAGVTLNVNNLGAKPIRVNKNGYYEDPGADWGAGFSYIFLFDGINDRWLMIGRDFDKRVSQSSSTTSQWRKVLVSYNYTDSPGNAISAATNVVYYATGVDIQPSTGKISANAFVTRNGTPSQFVKGDGTLGTFINILTGTSEPSNDVGSDGDIYIKTTA